MCDTIVVTPEASQDGVMLFGKNSDRQPNEAHYVTVIPAADYPQGSEVKCTYRSIPQVRHTYAVLLAKPFWMWGAEMGANEHGVVIGNEAVFTKVPQEKEPALTGMDMLRLALERAESALEAVQLITELLEQYGQGGNCGYLKQLYYHNSYLIADPRQAWVLETAGVYWAAKQVHGVYTISNRLSLGSEWDLASPSLVSYAVEKGWCKRPVDFDFSRCYSEPVYTYFAEGYQRSCRTRDHLHPHSGKVTVANLMAALRDHGDEPFYPDRGITGPTVCAHASIGPIRSDQTTGSMVSHLHPQHPSHWVTGTAAPCTSLYLPAWLDTGLHYLGPQPTGTFDAGTLFWRHELLHRATLENYPAHLPLFSSERDAIESSFTTGALALAHLPAANRLEFAARCYEQAETARADWLERVESTAKPVKRGWLHRRAWDRINKKAQLVYLKSQ
ncbi:MAG: peptidase family protein [Chloroflexi bacterium]|nr:peptidase family protein [Chloroflexota bacterium]